MNTDKGNSGFVFYKAGDPATAQKNSLRSTGARSESAYLCRELVSQNERLLI
jgi:hypothetical protein